MPLESSIDLDNAPLVKYVASPGSQVGRKTWVVKTLNISSEIGLILLTRNLQYSQNLTKLKGTLLQYKRFYVAVLKC